MEERIINYPVKYALLAMLEPNGWVASLNELERDYSICGYVVSKVYLMGMNMKYLSDGSSKISYEVVFPYKSIINLEKRNVPKFNLYGECYNFDTVLGVYDNFKEASEMAEHFNHVLRREYMSSISLSSPNWKFELASRQDEFNNRLKGYKEFEQVILEKSQDMIVLEETKYFGGISKILEKK